MKRIAWLLVIVSATVACGKKAPGASADVIAAWKQGKLEPSEFKAAKTDVGTDCVTGTVNKLDVLLCTFPTDKEAKAAEDAGLKWVGDTTGASQATGQVLIAVADRKKVDPNGKTINQIVTLPAK